MGSQTAAQFVKTPVLQSTLQSADLSGSSLPVFWIYIDDEGRWCLRKEGGAAEASFSSRSAAVAFVQDLARNSPYRLFIETQDGKIVQEQHGCVSGACRGDERGIIGRLPAAIPDTQISAGTPEPTDLGRRLEWASRLESVARVSPSRLSLLAHWVHRKQS